MDSLHPFSTKMMPLLSNNPTGLPKLSNHLGFFQACGGFQKPPQGGKAQRAGGFPSQSTHELSVVWDCFLMHWREHSHHFLLLEMFWEC